ncbi:hypothetical protein LPJ59_003071 [Coemansia sp. RSA 2399]|nr:hypothetical protein LPJ59_003071 [Coemansia sp. RSA 2399]KAJ1904234.1 hypothetical protein LPJ81_002615 [Coemansia sp. IMI 209127]
MPSATLTTNRRRRLFTRRELRHNGTYVVQVGSQNVLEKRRNAKYTYAQVAAHNTPSAAESCADDSAAEAIVLSSEELLPLPPSDIVESATENNSKQHRRNLMHVSEGARRLLVPSTQRRKHRRLTDITGTSGQQLPPPLDIDRTILSFPEPLSLAQRPPLGAKSPRFRPSPPPPQPPSAAMSPGRRRWSSHLTPLRAVCERLRPMRNNKAPPAFDLSKFHKP